VHAIQAESVLAMHYDFVLASRLWVSDDGCGESAHFRASKLEEAHISILSTNRALVLLEREANELTIRVEQRAENAVSAFSSNARESY